MAQNKKRPREAESIIEGQQDGINTAEPAGSPPQKKQQQRRSLFVRSLPATATTESLIAYFSQSYPIKHATVVVDPATKKSKGYGFVTFTDAEDAQKAVQEFNGTAFEGRKIKIEVAEPRQRDVEDAIPGAVAAGQAKPRSVPSAAVVEPKAKRQQEKQLAHQAPRLIVRNLPWSIKKPEQLSALFQSYGKIKQVVLPSPKPGLMSGFGFVLLRGRKNAEKAMQELNGKEFDGRPIAVDWAVDKKVWETANQEHDKDGVNSVDAPATGSNGEALGNMDGVEPGSVIPDIEEDGAVVDENMDKMLDEDEDDNAGQDEDGDEDMDEDDDIDDETSESPPQMRDNSATLFIRNLPFTSTDENIRDHFLVFGPIRYARVVMDPSTERPRGTGFVCFVNAEDALQCLREAPRPDRNRPQRTGGNTETGPSILQNEADDPSGKYTIDGRVLQLARAVAKDEATRLTEEGIDRRGERDKDRRRLYLLSEGTISTKSPLYALLSPSEIAMREASAKQRKQLTRTNPSLHLSLTRLSVRNIPRSITSQDLKALAREAVVGFAKDVKEGNRERLSKEELARGAEEMKEAEKERKKRGVGLVKQAKIVFEGQEGSKVSESSGGGRSRGYGFIEYYTHRSALMGLRWLNGHVVDYKAKQAGTKAKGTLGKEELAERKKRLIVEFAIENAQVVNRRKDRERKVRSGPSEDDQRKKAGFQKRDGPNKATAPTGKANPATSEGVDAKDTAHTEPLDKDANRQRIIGRKRAARKARRGGA